MKTTAQSAAAAWRRLIAPRPHRPLRHHATLTATGAFAFIIFMGISWGVF